MHLSETKFAHRKGQSFRKTMVCALAAIAALGGGSTSLSQTQPAQAPERQPTGLSRAEQHAAVHHAAAIYRQIFDPAESGNPFPGVSYRDLAAEDFQRLPREGNTVIVGSLLNYSVEFYDVVDSIRPTAMTREQFLHVLLRETARRELLNSNLNNTGYVPPAVTNRNVAVSRPLDVPPAERSFAAIPALDVVVRDIATTLLRNPRRIEVEMERDVAVQIGYLNGGGAILIDDDMSAFIAGYAAGANPLSFNGRQPGRPAGPLPLSVGFDSNVTDAEIRTAYCAIVTAITEPRRARGVDQNMAVSAGFLMAREDARSGFASNDVRLGAFDQFCPPRPPQWDPTTMGRAITGIVLEGAGHGVAPTAAPQASPPAVTTTTQSPPVQARPPLLTISSRLTLAERRGCESGSTAQIEEKIRRQDESEQALLMRYDRLTISEINSFNNALLSLETACRNLLRIRGIR